MPGHFNPASFACEVAGRICLWRRGGRNVAPAKRARCGVGLQIADADHPQGDGILGPEASDTVARATKALLRAAAASGRKPRSAPQAIVPRPTGGTGGSLADSGWSFFEALAGWSGETGMASGSPSGWPAHGLSLDQLPSRCRFDRLATAHYSRQNRPVLPLSGRINILDSAPARLIYCGHGGTSAIPSFARRAFADMHVPAPARRSVIFIGEMANGRFSYPERPASWSLHGKRAITITLYT